jgi:N-sulfoglucosamine sulfohydrolase
MITRSFRLISFLVLGIPFTLFCSKKEIEDTEKVARPNVVLIIADDVSVSDFGCYGNPNIRTPNIDKLASDGMRFTNAYLTTSQCSPTRCSIITGRYPHNTGAPELHIELPEGQIMLPAMLKQAGYHTLAVGKWHMGNYAKGAFDKVLEGGVGGEENWVESLQLRPKEKPFFMWFASYDAHRSWQVDAEAKPHSPEDAVIPPYLIDTPESRKDMAMYYDEIQRLDRYVGLVVKELKAQGVFENTCIIFMADNGRPFPRCKTRLYDSGIKTPFIIHWPAGLNKQGVVSNSLLSSIDIAPTILELAGLDVSESFQGISITPLLDKPKASVRDYVFAEHNWHGQIAHERMVRHGDYVYIRNAHPQLPQICRLDAQCPQEELREMARQGKLTTAQMDPLLEPRPSEELFDLKNDPYQLTNLAGNLNYSETLSQLQKVMDEWQESTGDTTPSLKNATPDRWDRRTGKRIYEGSRPPSGILPGEATNASKVNNPGPR